LVLGIGTWSAIEAAAFGSAAIGGHGQRNAADAMTTAWPLPKAAAAAAAKEPHRHGAATTLSRDGAVEDGA